MYNILKLSKIATNRTKQFEDLVLQLLQNEDTILKNNGTFEKDCTIEYFAYNLSLKIFINWNSESRFNEHHLLFLFKQIDDAHFKITDKEISFRIS